MARGGGRYNAGRRGQGVEKLSLSERRKSLEREAMWYEYQRKNANREYNEMMLRGEE